MTIKHGIKPSLETVKHEFESRGCILLSTKYVNALTPLDYICHCGTVASIRLSKLRAGQECINCARRKTRLGLMTYTFKEVESIFKLQGLRLLEWHGTNAQLKFLCHCGNTHITKVAAHNLYKIRSCPDCAKAWSLAQGSKNTEEYKEWRLAVYKKDNYTCNKCGTNRMPRAHHLENWSRNTDLRFVISNGAVLCERCHIEFHSLYGRYTNKAQYEDYTYEH